MDKNEINRLMIESVSRLEGILNAFPLADGDHQRILAIEQDAEDRSLMGLGKVVNSGVRTVLTCDPAYVALTSMKFNWGCHATLVLKKGQEVVGEEVRDKEAIERLSKLKNVWFMHKNFVVYRDKISFPSDIMKKICHFEIPHHSWDLPEEVNLPSHCPIFATPATPCDLYLKEKYFKGQDERGLGTILIGLKKNINNLKCKDPRLNTP